MELYLHKPMFYFLSMLAFINLVLFLTTVLKMQSFFWFNIKDITLSICLIRLLALARAAGIMLPLPFLLHHLPYGLTHAISHSYCEHTVVVKLACANTRFSNIYGNIIAPFTMGLDLLSIRLSYIRILRIVLGLACREERLNAFGTCISHNSGILVLYNPTAFLWVIRSFGCHVVPDMHILMTSPIVYDV